MSFAKDIWDGIDKVSDHITIQLTIAKDLSDMMAKRAKYEEDYAKHMTELGKQLPGDKKAPAAAKAETTMHDAIEAVVSCTSSVAKAHADMAEEINTQIVKPFSAFLKAKEADRKRLLKDGEKKSKTLKDMETTAKKSQDQYEKAASDARAAVETEKKAKNDLAENPGVKKLEMAVPKAEAVRKKAVDRMAQAEKIAESAFENVNKCMQKTYDEEMPEILNEMQKLSEEVFDKIVEFLAVFTTAHERFETPYKEAFTVLSEKAKEKLSKEADMNEFIEKAKSEKEKYELLEFKKLPNPAEEEEEPAAAAAAASAEEPKEEEKKEEEKKEEEKKEEEKKEEEKKEEEKKEEEKPKEEEKKEEEKPKEEEKKEEEKPKEEEKKEEEKPKEEEKKEEEKPKEEEKKEEEKPKEEEKKEDA